MGRLARIGASPEDGRDEALRKETLVLAAVLITALAVGWVGFMAGIMVPLSQIVIQRGKVIYKR